MPELYVNKNMRSVQVPVSEGFDPVAKPRAQKWEVTDNRAPSVLDALFPDEREAHPKGTLTIKIETQNDAVKYTDALGRVALNRQALVEHSEERIHAFLMQIIDCYDTDLHFTVGETQDQTKSISAVKFAVKAGVPKPAHFDPTIKFESAHHGTLPCIYAYPRVAWTQWKTAAGNNPNHPGKPNPKVYLKHSDTYYLNNACTGLTKVINQGENNYLDGKASEKSVEFGLPTPPNRMLLREYTIDLLNRAARKEIDPLQGLSLFMEKFQAIVKRNADALPLGETKETFAAWNQELEDLQAQYQGNYKWFVARLMGRYIPRPDRDAINIEEIVFPRHCKLIQKKDLSQNQTAAKVDALGRNILAGTNKTVQTFDKALKVAILTHSSQNATLKKYFQRFYACNGKSQLELENEIKKPARQLLASKQAQDKIEAFLAEFSGLVHNYQIEESHFQSHLLVQIRKMRGLSLRRFAEKHNQEFPDTRPLNYEQLRRIENGCVPVTPEMAERYAKILDVSKRVFQS
ncbi:MAG: helix-turn-helix transcriptional regulator [Parachlamydia sp.]|nr:helix-turn-helix transcriptional regulator [Parachlamydia sp.]